jgi:hypothetical protein
MPRAFDVRFLYMDETYPDFSLPRRTWSVCLTGMLVPAASHREIRARFYNAVADAVGRQSNTVPPVMEIHAATLLPDSDDVTRIAFLANLVSIITDYNLSLFRVGYRRTRTLLNMCGTNAAILGLAFGGMLNLMSQELESTPIWPVMETDRSNLQDQSFAGAVQFTDHIAAHIGADALSRDQSNLGEVLYSTKRSIYGALVDCAAYLLNVRTLAAQGVALSDYKRQLCTVASQLLPIVQFDEIITMRLEMPSPENSGDGGSRPGVRIVPNDSSDQ